MKNLIMGALLMLAVCASQASQSQKSLHATEHSKSVSSQEIPEPQQKIAAYIFHVLPEYGKTYAHTTARHIYESAQRRGICPYWVAAQDKVESNYQMSARSQIGISQFTRGTGREMKRQYGYDIYKYRDNIWAGTTYLAQQYYEQGGHYLASRGSGSSRDFRNLESKMFVASARYNNGPRGERSSKGRRYASKVLRIRRSIIQFTR